MEDSKLDLISHKSPVLRSYDFKKKLLKKYEKIDQMVIGERLKNMPSPSAMTSNDDLGESHHQTINLRVPRKDIVATRNYSGFCYNNTI